MRKRGGVIQAYNEFKTSFVRSSMFYGMALDKRHSIFDQSKFINDPWPGSALSGKDFLDGKIKLPQTEIAIDISNIISSNNNVSFPVLYYIMSFSWMRDVQAVGGNNARKYIRNVVSAFIDVYRKTPKFWMKPDWDVDITSERIVNWILLHSFFVMGASDSFQKTVLSSLCEQYSHITKMYKAETDPLILLKAHKAMLFCLCLMKNKSKRQIYNILDEITKITESNVDDSGTYITLNPINHFTFFKSLLEIRFIARNNDIKLSENVFYNKLSKMASVVRFFRLGDGSLSNHCGYHISNTQMITPPKPSMIDTALSLVNTSYSIKTYHKLTKSFDRIATKKSIVIVNKIPQDSRYRENPGIKVCDFEASFKTNKLIHKADILIKWHGYMVKPGKFVEPFTKISRSEKNILYTCEMANFDRSFRFAVRRELLLDQNYAKLQTSDFFYSSDDSDVYIIITLSKNVLIDKNNASSLYITCDKNKYLFLYNGQIDSGKELWLNLEKPHAYPSVTIHYKNLKDTENRIDWSVEEV